ncbi:hypothetical protein JCM16138_13840 [Thermococcus atlanticus]
MPELGLRSLNITLGLVLILASRLSPYMTLLIPWYLGFLIVSRKGNLDPLLRLSVSPAIGLAVIIFLMHILSWLGISLGLAYIIVVILTLAISLLAPSTGLRGDVSKSALAGMTTALFLSFVIKLPFFRVPAYPGAVGRDAVFHAYKSLEILRENTLFIKSAPPGFHGIITYPAGYHSIIVFLAKGGGINVAEAMLILKIFTWIFIPLGTYAAARSIFRSTRIAVFSAILAPISYLYYYYLNYSLLHQFLNYYMFLAAVSLYTLSIDNHRRSTAVLAVLIISAVLLVHPYVYLAFEAYALFAVLMILIRRGRIEAWPVKMFLSQAAASFLTYYILEYPMRLHIMNYTSYFGSPKYAFKDNLLWVEGILHSTFISEGQVIIGIFFVAGIIYAVKHESPFSVGMIATIFYTIFLVFNKILFHIPIPFYSGIWSSERIYVLITPMIPVIAGAGMHMLHRLLEGHSTRPKVVAASLTLLLMVPAFYVNIWNLSFETAGCVTGASIEAFRFIGGLPAGRILVPRFYDSGMWAGIYLPERNITFIKNATGMRGILYVDSRGYGDFKINPFNPWNLSRRYRVIYFRDNIWIFNLSDEASSYPLSLYRYYRLEGDEIRASDMSDWRYLSYGFLLRHPAIIRGIRFEGWKIVLVRSREAVIAIVPSRNYAGVGIEVYPGGNGSINIDVDINGKTVGKIRRGGYWKFEYRLKEGELYIITLKGEPGYAFVRMKLEGGG